MLLLLFFSLFATYIVAGQSDAQITARAELHVRQSEDSANVIGYQRLGGFWGQSPQWSQLVCNDAEVYQSSDSYARCGDARSSDNQYPTACSDNTLVYVGSKQETCDSPSATCGTAFVLPTVDATQTVTMVSCWPTRREEESLIIVRSTIYGPVNSTAAPTPSQTSASGDNASQTDASPISKTSGSAGSVLARPAPGLVSLVVGLLALL